MNEYVYQLDSNFRIRWENFGNVIEALKKYSDGADSIVDAFLNMDFSVAFDEGDNIYAIWFEGEDMEFHASGEGLPHVNEDDMFADIAKYVEDGSYLTMFNDSEHNSWRWYFKDGKVQKVAGRFVYPFGPDVPAERKWARD